jgi:hypothetical protein
LQVELSVPGPHPDVGVVGGGIVPPVLLLGFVLFSAGLTVPGGTLIMLTGGGVPVLLLAGGAFVGIPIGLSTPPVFPVLLPVGGAIVGTPVGPRSVGVDIKFFTNLHLFIYFIQQFRFELH